MKTLRSLLITITLLLITFSHAYSMEFKNIVVLGDSLSDNGNLFAVHGFYPPPPYYEGRASDGPVWSEYIAEKLGFTGKVLNYAHAGAQSGTTNVNGDFPGFLNEVEAYLSMAEISTKFPGSFAMPEDSLFIIWIGNNDFLKTTDIVEQIGMASSNIKSALSQLIDAGASKFIFINIPDFGKTPRFNKNQVMSAQATQISAGANQAIGATILEITSSNPDISMEYIDTFSILAEFITNAELLGFTNTVDSKLNLSTGESSEGNYMFWDDIHPTTFTHKLLAAKIAEFIKCDNCNNNIMPYFESDFTLKIPSARLGDKKYEFTLVPYANPDISGVFWALDADSVKVQ